jgi:hypothetical protein
LYGISREVAALWPRFRQSPPRGSDSSISGFEEFGQKSGNVAC